MPPTITAAPHPIVFDDVEYSMHPFRDKDYDEVNEWLRSRIISIARKSIAEVRDQDERDEVLGAAVREAAKVDLVNGSGFRSIQSPDGVTRLFYQSVKRGKPEFSFDDARKVLRKPDGLPDAVKCLEVMTVWADINGIETKKKKKEEDSTQQNGSPKE